MVERVQPLEVEVSPIHDVKCPWLQRDEVEGVDLVEPAIGNVDEARDVATQIEQGMQFHRSLCRSELCPGKH